MEYVIVAAPIHRAGAYILDKFLKNQKEIQDQYSSSELLLATVEKDFIAELQHALRTWDIRGEVLLYEVIKPDYALSTVWNTACGREKIRKYFLSKPEASHLLFIDADMVCDSRVVDILKREIGGHDMVASGYMDRNRKGVIIGTGCMLFARRALEKIMFRCYEFRNRQAVDEAEVMDMDIFSRRLHYRRGYYLSIDHYSKDGSFGHMEPHPVGFLGRISNSLFLRYLLVKSGIILHCNISNSLYKKLHKALSRLH